MRFQRSVNTVENAGTQATKHNDYKRPGASMRPALWLVFNAVALNCPPHPRRYRPNRGSCALCKMSYWPKKRKMQQPTWWSSSRYRNCIARSVLWTLFTTVGAAGGLSKTESHALLWACQKLFKKLISRDNELSLWPADFILYSTG